MRTFSLGLFVCLLCCNVFGESSPKEHLHSATTLFNRGHYKQAIEQLSDIDVRKDFDDSDDMKIALKIRAISLNESGDKTGAIENIRELYFLDPHYRFDAFDTPSDVMQLAERELKVIEEKNKQLASIKISQPLVNAQAKTQQKINLTKPKMPISNTLFPFGINHYLLNSPIKASVYLSLQGLSLLGNIGAYWWKQSYLDEFGSSRLSKPEYKSRFEAAQIIQYVALGTFVVSLGASIVDALITYSNDTSKHETTNEIAPSLHIN
ncbi:MAG: hypothetical protein KC505_05610 [Myxococcales bacterium]|nr:hypothetical protein [Myxococcales bacterium]USN51739.1 MAG: hypothetical protein H6731_04850 [Myxococcales bacterium]